MSGLRGATGLCVMTQIAGQQDAVCSTGLLFPSGSTLNGAFLKVGVGVIMVLASVLEARKAAWGLFVALST